MISAQQVIDSALDAAHGRGRADETIVLVTDRVARRRCGGRKLDDHQRRVDRTRAPR